MCHIHSDMQTLLASAPASFSGLFAGTCILFGDGCGAVLMTSQEGSCSLLGSSMCSDGLGQKHLKVRTVSDLALSPVHQMILFLTIHSSILSSCLSHKDEC